jgi:hypothetical protein
MQCAALVLALTMFGAQPPSPPGSPAASAPKSATAPNQPSPEQKPPAPSPPPSPAPASASQPPPPKSAAAASASQPPSPKSAAPASASQEEGAAPPPAENYSYRAEGRRDPFQSLLGAGTGMTGSRKGDGPSGMTVAEISVRGIMQSRGALIAMVHGPDNKTYIVHQGDKLLDGTIKTITPQGLVVVQEVNDPLSLVKQREVRKLLRSLEDAKE